MPSKTTQLTASHIIQNWRTITVPQPFLAQLDIQTVPESHPLEDENFSSNAFDKISATDLHTTEKVAPAKAKPDDSTSSFVDVGDDDAGVSLSSKSFNVATNTQTGQLTDQQIIALADALEVQFTGSPVGTNAGFNTITKARNEKKLTFAKRRLAAIAPPLLYLDDKLAPALAQKIQLINNWHQSADLSSPKSSEAAREQSYQQYELDKALAETCYFFDPTHKRLVVRHTPIQTISGEDVDHSRTKLTNITMHLMKYATKGMHDKTSDLKIHHIIPTIEKVPSIDEYHIVLTLVDQWKEMEGWVFHAAVVDSKEKMPLFLNQARESLVFTLLENSPRYYLAVQNWRNQTDCGKHITIMAIAAMRLLTENPEESVGKMELKEFEPFKPKIMEAASQFNTQMFKRLLAESQTVPTKARSHSQTPVAPQTSDNGMSKMMQFAMAAAATTGILLFRSPPARPADQHEEENESNKAQRVAR